MHSRYPGARRIMGTKTASASCGPAHQLTRGRLAVTGILRLLLLLNLEIVGNFFYATNAARYLFRAGSVLRRSNDSV